MIEPREHHDKPAMVKLSHEEVRALMYDDSEAPIFRFVLPHAYLDFDDFEEGEMLCVLCIAVDPEYRRRGLATRLITALVEFAEGYGKGIDWGVFVQESEVFMKPLIRRLDSNYRKEKSRYGWGHQMGGH